MTKSSRLFAATGLLALSVLFAAAGSAGASPQPTPAATIGVSPAVQSVVARPDQTALSYTIHVTNNGTEPAQVSLSATNFTTLGTGNTIRFLPAKTVTKHGLASSLSLPPLVELAANESRTVTITINGLQQLAAGGHYTAVLVQTIPKSTSSSTLKLKQSVASLVFLTTAGQGTYGLQLQPLRLGIAWLRTPPLINLLFKNTGNVQTTPRGYINLSGPFSHFVSKTILNPNSSLVLPGTNRLLQTALPNDHPILPGRYSAHIYYRYDNSGQYQVTTTHFWYIGWLGVLIIIFVFIGLIFGIVRYKKVFKKI